MKFSKPQHSKIFSSFVLTLALLVIPASFARAEFTDVTQLSRDLDTLIGNLQKVQNLAGAGTGGTSPTQISSTINTLTNLSTGIRSLQGVLDIPVIAQNGGFQSAAQINDSIQGLGAILDTPLFSNFEGAQKLSSTLNTVGNAATALSNIGKILDIPELKNLGGLINDGTSQGGVVGGIGSSVLGGVLGGSGNQLSAGLQKLVGVVGENNGLIEAVSGVANIPGLDALKKAVGNIPATGTGLISESGPSCASSANVGGTSSVAGSAVNFVANAATNQIKNAASSLFNSAVGPLSSIVGGAIGTNTKGVPVIEQDGTLINLSKQNTNLAAVICQHLATIRAIEEFKNPDARAEAQKKLQAQLDIYRGEEATGRTTAFGVANQSVIVDRQTWVGEKVRAKTGLALQQLAEAPIPSSFKQSVLNQITREEMISQDRSQNLIALVQGSQPQSSDPWDAWTQSLRPENNPIGSYLLAREYVDQIKAEAEQDAAQTWEAGGGYVPTETCVGEYKNTPFGKVCTRQEVQKPGSFYQNRGAIVDTSGIRVAEQTDLFQGDQIATQALANERESSLGSNQGRKDIGISDIFSVVDEICNVKSDLSICKSKDKAQNILGTLSQVTGIDLFGGSSNTASLTAGLAGATSNVTSGLTATNRNTPPVISFATSDTSIAGKSGIVEIAWQAQGASTCMAGNDWVTYGTTGEPTLFPTVLFPEGTEFSVQNGISVSRPGLFAVSIGVRGTGIEQTNVTSKLSGGMQIVTYTPNVQGIRTTDQFTLEINGQTISTHNSLPDTAPAAIVAELKSAKASLPNGSSAKAEFDQYQFGGSTSLIISRNLPGTVPISAQYTLECSGPGGTASKTATINF